MTCIAAIKEGGKVYMASDSLVSCGGVAKTSIGGKIVKRDDILFGISGLASIKSAIKYDLSILDRLEKYSDEEYVYNLGKSLDILFDIEHKYRSEGSKFAHISMLIAYKGELYDYGCDGSILRYTDSYIAVGSGGDHAEASLFTTDTLGTLNPKERLELAIKAAIKFVPSCGGDITYAEV